MKAMLKIFSLLILTTLFIFDPLSGVSDEKNPTKGIDFDYPDEVKIQAGGRAVVTMNVTVPGGHHIYIKHINKKSYSILTSFSIDPKTGFQIVDVQKPKGKKHFEDEILMGKGTYKLTVFEIKGNSAGTEVEVPIDITTQMCEKKTGICYPPFSFKKKITFEVTEKDMTPRVQSVSGSDGIKWIESYKKALDKARRINKNVYAVITAPTWCGACRWMDQKTFSKSNIQKKLNRDFVPLKILDTNPDKSKFNFRGYPTSIVISNRGKELYKKAGGLPPDYLMNILNKYTRKGSPVKPEKKDPINWRRSFETAFKQSKQSNKKVYVIITAPEWCKACTWMEKYTFSRKDVQDTLNKYYIPLKILDTDVQKRKFKFNGYPTSVILDSDGDILHRAAGGIGGGDLMAMLQKYLQKKKEEPEVDPADKKDEIFTDKKILPLTDARGGGSATGTKFNDDKMDRVLVGLKVRSGNVVDSVTPIYRIVKKDGTLGREIVGKQFGGDGGNEVILKKDGHVIVGLDVYEGPWYGHQVTKQIKVIWKKWQKGATGWEKRSRALGDGYIAPGGGSNKRIRAQADRVAIGIHGRSLKYLNRISLITAKLK